MISLYTQGRKLPRPICAPGDNRPCDDGFGGLRHRERNHCRKAMMKRIDPLPAAIGYVNKLRQCKGILRRIAPQDDAFGGVGQNPLQFCLLHIFNLADFGKSALLFDPGCFLNHR